ncbi:MAG: hypothetical protein GY754_15545 [bacterium]|nr:hypothetical protein [bacterium]
MHKETIYKETVERFGKICAEIYKGIPAENRWQWDKRFDVPVIIVGGDNAESVLVMVTEQFEVRLDGVGDNLSVLVNKVLESIGGIESGQLVFYTIGEESLILYAAWWPWNDGKTISLRIGIESLYEDSFNRKEITGYLKDWFKLQ